MTNKLRIKCYPRHINIVSTTNIKYLPFSESDFVLMLFVMIFGVFSLFFKILNFFPSLAPVTRQKEKNYVIKLQKREVRDSK